MTDTPHPLAEAFRQSSRGDVIEVEPGTYPGFLMGFNNPHRQDNVFDGVQGVVLRARLPRTVTLDSGGSDTLLIQQPVDGPHFRDIAFVGLRIRTGGSAAVRFDSGGRYHGFEFHDIHITGEGRTPKWGVRIFSAGDVVFDGCLIEEIPLEHGIYSSNNIGPFLVQNTTIRNVGRAAIQLREVELSEAPVLPSAGRTIIRNNCFINPGRNDGASALTLTGCDVVDVVGNMFVSGFGDAHNSRGAIVAFGTPLYGKAFANGCITLTRNTMLWRNPDRAVVALSSTNRILMRGNTIATDTQVHPALDLSVAGAGPANRRVAVSGTDFGRGAFEARFKVRRLGSLLSDSEIEALEPGPHAATRCND